MKHEVIQIIQGDITKLNIEAIVNAANTSLLGGGGVDGAIHRAAGKGLLEECKKLNGCKTGEAKITKGYNLFAKHVIHTVGPVWRGGNNGEPELLKSAYVNCLNIAVGNNIKSIAFPSISTGIYGYPIEHAAKIAVETANEFLTKNDFIEKIVFVCFSKNDYDIYYNKLTLTRHQQKV